MLPSCKNGLTHIRRTLGRYGIDAPGGMAQHVALPPEVLCAALDGMDLRTATLAGRWPTLCKRWSLPVCSRVAPLLSQ